MARPGSGVAYSNPIITKKEYIIMKIKTLVQEDDGSLRFNLSTSASAALSLKIAGGFPGLAGLIFPCAMTGKGGATRSFSPMAPMSSGFGISWNLAEPARPGTVGPVPSEYVSWDGAAANGRNGYLQLHSSRLHHHGMPLAT
jgi:hypothetical protein